MKKLFAFLAQKIQTAPLLLWAAAGVLPAFFLFWVVPMYFRANLTVHYPNGYLPKVIPIGNDFRLALQAAQAWADACQLTDFIFTPAALAFFTPFIKLEYARAYHLFVLLILFSYLTFAALTLLLVDAKHHAAAVFLLLASAYSYGVQFELERGQSHSIALALTLAALYLFHQFPRARWLSYVLFSLSIQLKFYPALFVVFFVDDWRAWKPTLIRFGALGLANILALFLLGGEYFTQFYQHMLNSAADGEIALGNHSIQSFLAMLSKDGLGMFEGAALNWIQVNRAALFNGLSGYVVAGFALILVLVIRRNQRGTNPNLLLAAVIVSLTLPSVNHDYTLPLLTVPFTLAFIRWGTREYRWGKFTSITLLVVSALTYSVTLFPLNHKPLWLNSSLPALLILLAIAALFSLVEKDAA
ncbi:MAG: hypothetical protein Fur002_15860 [Anaerolineales bacterium]